MLDRFNVELAEIEKSGDYKAFKEFVKRNGEFIKSLKEDTGGIYDSRQPRAVRKEKQKRRVVETNRQEVTEKEKRWKNHMFG